MATIQKSTATLFYRYMQTFNYSFYLSYYCKKKKSFSEHFYVVYPTEHIGALKLLSTFTGKHLYSSAVLSEKNFVEILSTLELG